MSDDESNDKQYAIGPKLAPISADEIRAAMEQQKRDLKEAHAKDEEYKKQQTTIQKGMLNATERMSSFTMYLVILGVFGSSISFYAARSAQISAEAASVAANAAAEQFRLTRQQLEYTQRARIVAEAGFMLMENTVPTISLTLRNEGSEHATSVSVEFSVTQKNIASDDTVVVYRPPFGTTIPNPIDSVRAPGNLGPGNDTTHTISKNWPLSPSRDDLRRLLNTEDFLEGTLKLDYFDGFQQVSETKTLVFVTYYDPACNYYVGSTFFPSQEFKTGLSFTLGQRKYHESYKKTHPCK